MKKKITIYSILFILLLIIPLALSHAQEFAKVGTVGAQFLKIGMGARAVGMGEAFAAVGNDVSALFWNPAGLTGVKNNSLFLARAEWLADIDYTAAGFAKNIPGVGTVGVSFASLNSGDMDETTVAQQEGTGRTFHTGDLMIGVAFARMLTDKFALGGNVKYIREGLVQGLGGGDDEAATAWAVDLGTLYYTGFRSLRMGLSVRNFGPELKFAGTYNDWDNGTLVIDPNTGEPWKFEYLPYHMPLTFKLGLAMEPVVMDNQKLTVAMDLVHPNDNVERIHFGAEYTLMNMIVLRAGYVGLFGILGRVDTEIEDEGEENEREYDIHNYAQNLSAGVGFRLNLGGLGKVNIDYAYSDFGVLDWVHRASLNIDF